MGVGWEPPEPLRSTGICPFPWAESQGWKINTDTALLEWGNFISGKKEREKVSSLSHAPRQSCRIPVFPGISASSPSFLLPHPPIPIMEQPLKPIPIPSLPEEIPVVLLLFIGIWGVDEHSHSQDPVSISGALG